MVVHDMRNPTCSIEHCLDEMAGIVGLNATEIDISEDESEADECVHSKAKKCRYAANCKEKVTSVGLKRGISEVRTVELSSTAQEREFESLFGFADTAVVEDEMKGDTTKLLPYSSRPKNRIMVPKSRSSRSHSSPKWIKSDPATGQRLGTSGDVVRQTEEETAIEELLGRRVVDDNEERGRAVRQSKVGKRG